MNLLINDNPLLLWRDTIKDAEERCSVTLKQELETYLISLLDHYSNQPELTKQLFAQNFLRANQNSDAGRMHSLRVVGDQCLLYAGLFPDSAKRKLVRVSYFVNLGRSAYHMISCKTNDLFGNLAFDFVILMDVLQSIRTSDYLLPIDAYEQWQELGSKRALHFLRQYTRCL